MQNSQRQKQKKETRIHLIEAAMSQFAKDGLISTRTSDIAVSANVSHGTIFAHFPTRDALLDKVIEEFGLTLSKRLHELNVSNCCMRDVLEAHLKGIGEHEAFYTRLVIEAPLLNKSSRNTLIMIQSSISLHFSHVAEREMEASRIIKMPFPLMFNTWVGLVHYYLSNNDLFAPRESVISRYGKELINHFMQMISKQGGEDN